MVQLSSSLKRLGGDFFQPFISNHDFIIGRNNNTFELVVIKDNKAFKSLDSLNANDTICLREILNNVNFDVFIINDISYLFNLDNNDERHKFNVIEYLSNHYPHTLNDYNFMDFEICTNGDVVIDGVTIPTKVSYYDA